MLGLDFSVPGSEGTLPANHDEFQRGLIYTVHPRLLAPLQPGRDYRITASTRRKIGDAIGSFAPLYGRVTSLVRARAEELTCDPPHAFHTWIASHAWFRMELPRFAMAGAVVTLGVTCGPGDNGPASGKREPTVDELARPSIAQLRPDDYEPPSQGWDELYNEFDMRDEPSPDGSIVTFSYGEYVNACERIDYRDYVGRAEQRARRCYEPSARGSSSPLTAVRRDWTCIATSKASNVCLVHVNIYLQM
jgi:hypothetical protein